MVKALRSSGFDVLAVSEEFPASSDIQVIRGAVNEKRIILSEDKDFGE